MAKSDTLPKTSQPSGKEIKVWTDGACRGNPGPGGIGIAIDDPKMKGEISLGFYHTTNNRMELGAVIYALFYLKHANLIAPGDTIHFYTDSNLAVKGINEWMDGWVKKKFNDRENADLWQIIYLYTQRYNLVMHKVKGHAGVELNELCDLLANEGVDLPVGEKRHDLRYEKNQTHTTTTKFKLKSLGMK